MPFGIGIGLPFEIQSPLVVTVPIPWEPSQDLQGVQPQLWLRADQNVFTTGGVPADSTGDPVINWTSLEGNSYQFLQATLSKQPLYNLSGINSQASIDFDGIDNLLVHNSAIINTLEGTVIIIARIEFIQMQDLISSMDEGSNTRGMRFFSGRGTGADSRMTIVQRDDDLQDEVKGSTEILVNINYAFVFMSDGSIYTYRLNGNDEVESIVSGSNNGDWFGDTSLLDNLVIGAEKFTSEGGFFQGSISEVLIYPIKLTQESLNIASVYTIGRYGLAL